MEESGDWRKTLAAVWLAQAFSSIGFSFVFPFMPLYVQTLGISDLGEVARWAGMISAAAAVSMTIMQPVWGHLSDRTGRKTMLIRSMFGGGTLIGLMGFARSPLQVLVLRFLWGGITGVGAASTTLVATSAPKHRVGFALGLMTVAMFTGNSLGPLLGGLVADSLGYRAAFFGAGLCLFLGGLIAVFLIKENFVKPEPGQKQPTLRSESKTLFAISLFPVLLLVIFLIQLGATIVSPILSLFIAALNGPDGVATIAGTVFAVAGVTSALAAVVIGRISDQIGPVVILPICLLGAAAAYVPQAFVHQVWQLLALRVLLSVFLGGLMPSANTLVAKVVPMEKRGAAFGFTSMPAQARAPQVP